MIDHRTLADYWNARAQRSGNKLEGVLFKRFGLVLNAHLASAQHEVLARELLPQLPVSARVLDLGCGYGRVSKALRAQRPDLAFVGMDLSLNYCLLYRRLNVPVVCAALEYPPFGAKQFDALIAIITLMYVPPPARQFTLRSLASLLRPNGHLFAIEPGAEFQKLVSRFYRSDTSGLAHSFHQGELHELARNAGLVSVREGGFPGTTLLLPILFMLRGWPRALRPWKWTAAQIDRCVGLNGRHSVHRWSLYRRSVSTIDGY